MELCHKYGILFIADEVQSGFGRTGTLFASERYGIEPDLLVSAKSLGGGLPIAAVTGRAEIMDAPGIGGWVERSLVIHFPARRLWLCSIFSNERICSHAPTNWATVSNDGRASGNSAGPSSAMSGDWAACRRLNWCNPPRPKAPAADETKKITQYCYEHGLITITAGTYSNVIRVLVPLVITNEQMDEAMSVLESAIAAVCDQKGAVAQLV